MKQGQDFLRRLRNRHFTGIGHLIAFALLIFVGVNCGSENPVQENAAPAPVETPKGAIQGTLQADAGTVVQVRLLRDGNLLAQTEAETAYEFTAIASGTYTLQLSAKGYETTEHEVTLLPGQVLAVEELALVVLETPVAHLSGVLTDGMTGEPLGEVNLQLTDADGTVYETLTTDAGAFTFDNLPVEQTFTLAVAHDGYEATETDVGPIPASETMEIPLELAPLPEEKELVPGQGLSLDIAAPAFELTDGEGDPHTLEAYTGADKNVVVVFFRGGWGPFCRGQLVELQKNYDAIKAAGAELIAISSDAEAATKQNVKNQGLEFPVLADPDVMAISDYNVVDPGNRRIARPASYVIRQDGTIAWKSLDGLVGRVPTAQILAELGKL